MEQRFTFNSVAEQYDAARPGYPDELFDLLRDVAGLTPADRVLEVGCGTGLATEGAARLGVSITGIDPGADMIAVARRRLAAFPKVAFQLGRFEDAPVEAGAYAMVMSAQAFHWVPQEIGFPKAAGALRPGGVFALMGHIYDDPSDELMAAFEPIYKRHAPHLWGSTNVDWYLPNGPIPGLFAASGLFETPQHRVWRWRKPLSGEQFVTLIGTISAYLMLEAPVREALFDDLGACVDAAGGIDFDRDTHLHWAQRR